MSKEDWLAKNNPLENPETFSERTDEELFHDFAKILTQKGNKEYLNSFNDLVENLKQIEALGGGTSMDTQRLRDIEVRAQFLIDAAGIILPEKVTACMFLEETQFRVDHGEGYVPVWTRSETVSSESVDSQNQSSELVQPAIPDSQPVVKVPPSSMLSKEDSDLIARLGTMSTIEKNDIPEHSNVSTEKAAAEIARNAQRRAGHGFTPLQ